MPHIPKDEDVTVGQRLRNLRVKKGQSQTLLAKKVGISFQQIQKYETGTNRISVSSLVDLASALDVPTSYFLIGVSKTEKPDTPSTPEELQLLKLFRATQPQAQQSILRIAQETAQLCA